MAQRRRSGTRLMSWRAICPGRRKQCDHSQPCPPTETTIFWYPPRPTATDLMRCGEPSRTTRPHRMPARRLSVHKTAWMYGSLSSGWFLDRQANNRLVRASWPALAAIGTSVVDVRRRVSEGETPRVQVRAHHIAAPVAPEAVAAAAPRGPKFHAPLPGAVRLDGSIALTGSKGSSESAAGVGLRRRGEQACRH